MNAFVMAMNNGQMPVLFPGGDQSGYTQDTIHCAMTMATHFRFLADWINIRGVGIASPGDFLEWFSDQTTWPGIWAWFALIVNDHIKKERQ